MPYADTAQDQDGTPPGPGATPLISLSDLYDELAAQVYGIAAQVVGDADLAEDITERVLLELFRGALDGEGLGGLHQRATLLTHRAAVCSLRYGMQAVAAAAATDDARDTTDEAGDSTAEGRETTDEDSDTTAEDSDTTAEGGDTTADAAQFTEAPGATASAAPRTEQPDLATEASAVALLERLPEAEGLSDLQRQRVALAFYGGRTYAEIARLSGADPRDVSEDLCSSLRRLRP